MSNDKPHLLLYTKQRARQSADKFLKLLSDHKITISPGSRLEELILSLYEDDRSLLQYDYDSQKDVRPFLRELVGIEALIELILATSKCKSFSGMLNHLAILNACNCPSQNVKSQVVDQNSNKLFELLVAACAVPSSSSVILDHPTRSKGYNPDVIAEINGRKWGFACKAVHTYQPKTINDNILRAVNQIERADVDLGVVVLNIKNILDHDTFLPLRQLPDGRCEYGSYADKNIPIKMMYSELEQFRERILTCDNMKEVIERITESKCLPIVLVYTATTTSINTIIGPATTLLSWFFSLDFSAVLVEDFEVISNMNRFLQSAQTPFESYSRQ